MADYYLNIGSNLGHRELNISRALRELEKAFGWFETSKATTSKPWGFESSHIFMNIGVHIVSDMTPLEVLQVLKDIEKRLSPAPHRNPDGTYADRILDIDIMAAGDLTLDTPELTLPHPRMDEREFFLRPMADMAPGWRHPVSGKTAGEMLEDLKDR